MGTPQTRIRLPKPEPTAPALAYLLAILLAGVGGLVLFLAKSAVHEIEALILFLMASVVLAMATIAKAIYNLRVELWRYHSGDVSNYTLDASVPGPSQGRSTYDQIARSKSE